MATPTRIVRTFTETASTVPAVRIVRAFDCLVDSLQSAGYEGILVIDDETLGPRDRVLLPRHSPHRARSFGPARAL